MFLNQEVSIMSNIADEFRILFGSIPGQLVIQSTNFCNGACPQCGMRKTAPIKKKIPFDIIGNDEPFLVKRITQDYENLLSSWKQDRAQLTILLRS